MKRRAANVLLDVADPSDCFQIRWGLLTFAFQIRPISTKDNIRISAELCKMEELKDGDITYFQALMEHAENSEYINRAIAIATRTKHITFVTYLISTLSNKNQNILFKMLIKNSDAEVFFYTMALARKMNILKKKPE